MTFPPKVWDDVLRRLCAELPESVIETWLGPVVAEPIDGGLRLLCPNQFHCDRVRSALLPQIVACASEAIGENVNVILDIADPATAAQARFENKCAKADRADAEASLPTSAQTSAVTVSVPDPIAAQQVANTVSQLTDALSNDSFVSNASPPQPQRAPMSVRPDPAPNNSRARAHGRAPVQRRFAYTFDNFVVGPCNALAREASRAIAREEQEGLQQLYLNSPPGLGKTHLCRAAAGEAQARASQPVVYTSAEAFTSAFTSALRSHQISRFKQRFRKDPGVLVVEDVHFFAGKKQTQLEFFHTVRHLLDAGKRVMLTGDRLPKDFSGFEKCLQEQIQSGFMAELATPDATVRRGILRSKAAHGGVGLPEECLELLVESIEGSVRELEGALIQLVTTASLMKKPIDLALTRDTLGKRLSAPKRQARQLDVTAVLRVVALFFKTTPEALCSRSRRRDVVVPRQLAMYLCKRYTPASLSEIGAALGRNHPAVRNAITKTERAMLERAPLRYQVEALSDRLNELSAG